MLELDDAHRISWSNDGIVSYETVVNATTGIVKSYGQEQLRFSLIIHNNYTRFHGNQTYLFVIKHIIFRTVCWIQLTLYFNKDQVFHWNKNQSLSQPRPLN